MLNSAEKDFKEAIVNTFKQLKVTFKELKKSMIIMIKQIEILIKRYTK